MAQGSGPRGSEANAGCVDELNAAVSNIDDSEAFVVVVTTVVVVVVTTERRATRTRKTRKKASMLRLCA